MSSPADKVLVAQEGGIRIVTINCPDRRNAIDRETSLALAEAMDRLDAEPDLSLAILTGAGEHFCAGMDFKAFFAGERAELPGRGLAGITQEPPAKPLIAAIEGYALAGGFEIALACDLIVPSDTACLGLPEAKRGLIAGFGGLVRLPERMPRQIAKECALTGRMIPAAEAERWGLINRQCSTGTALESARVLAEEIAPNAPLSLAASKEIVTNAGRWSENSLRSRQTEILERVITSGDAREGASAFAADLAKRTGGDLKVRVSPASLLNLMQTFGGMKDGVVDGGYLVLNYFFSELREETLPIELAMLGKTFSRWPGR